MLETPFYEQNGIITPNNISRYDYKNLRGNKICKDNNVWCIGDNKRRWVPFLFFFHPLFYSGVYFL